jgi:hypothetical protein
MTGDRRATALMNGIGIICLVLSTALAMADERPDAARLHHSN